MKLVQGSPRLFLNIALQFAAVIFIGLPVSADAPHSAIAYFSRARNIKVTAAEKQNYFVVDEAIWQHARADLGDLRIHANQQNEIPYTLVLQQASTRSEHSTVPVLNKGAVRGQTQFAVDTGDAEYDNLQLDITTKNYIARATVEGENDLAGKNWSNLGTYTLYDFTKENLGSNSQIRFSAPGRFRFLRVTVAGPVVPDELKGASIANIQESKAKYVALSQVPSITSEGRKTVIKWDASDRVPLDRIHFDIDSAEVNFRRDVTVYCEDRAITTGELSRIRLTRKERKIESEGVDLNLAGLRCKRYKLEVHNGDDPALRITGVRPLMIERRIYFNPRGQSDLKLFYGDEKLSPPVYDYAKFFEAPVEANIAEATLGPDSRNAAFTGRPDDRPWTERHPAVLWAAMIAAVGLLGAWALRGFRA